ncbi:polyphosphate--glucose phosphotransferase [Nonomuraea sp. NEAU-A123]|uniref:polyphosphate--glucose phosphotransferase n=1 Tax=Nonomuraea sp. NEAU-A123 TaxID=2839649 RepID=UPI001BE4B3BA|nr:ROK family protein [Nonomuraea sp. NEAU-A123]MBT2226907.1 ROK family protein [Nonomuraea sp. NEAU-A123]
MEVLGIDIGGSGIKGAPVDTASGQLTQERLRIPTPQPAKPQGVAEVVVEIVKHFGWTGPVGVTFPGVVLNGVIMTAANVHHSWIGVDATKLFDGATVLNDADAAGIAEMRFGEGHGREGTVIMLTFGTGIGSAVFVDGVLVPNTELGHLQIHGKDAELRASDRAREEHDLAWDKWAGRVEEYLRHVEMLFWPSLFVIGGGVSKKADKFLPHVHVDTAIVPARLRNEAGIVGAALAVK